MPNLLPGTIISETLNSTLYTAGFTFPSTVCLLSIYCMSNSVLEKKDLVNETFTESKLVSFPITGTQYLTPTI